MPRQYVKPKYQADWGNKNSYLDKDVVIKIQPAPIKGWDAISPVAAMEPEYAVTLDNWVPRTGYCELRGGYNPWSQGLGVGTTPSVNTLMAYRPPNADEALFAASGQFIYNVSNYGPYTVEVASRLSDRWQHINFTPGGGASSYLLCVNGIDPCLAYNGTNWFIPAITGVSSTTLINIQSFKRRIWFVQKNSSKAWFLDTDAIQGAATALNLGPFMTKGGYLVAIATWTLDGGQGPDDYIVFITSSGQYIVYKGTDPTNANAWDLVGTFDVVAPIGSRCFTRFGADNLVITTQGVLPLSQALPFDPAATRSVAITNRIQNAMLEAAQAYKNFFGWQIISFPQQGLLVLNVPTQQENSAVQYVQNTITGAWCSFSGWNATCFEVFNGSLYFGGVNGSVNLAYTGPNDGGEAIESRMNCAFNYFDEPGRLKNPGMVRPFFVADGKLIPTIVIDADFETTLSPTTTVVGLSSGYLWDTALWDVALWGTNTIKVINWLSANALGTALSINMGINIGIGATGNTNNTFDFGEFDEMTFDGNGVITKSGQQIPILRVNVFELSLENGGPV